MTFTGRIRLALVLIALIPPMLAVAVTYWYSSHQREQETLRRTQESIHRYERFAVVEQRTLIDRVTAVKNSPLVQNAARRAPRTKPGYISLEPLPATIDFLEMIDTSTTVIASATRPGLVGQKHPRATLIDKSPTLRTVEYDRHGRHAALATSMPVDSNYTLYAGRFLKESQVNAVAELTNARVRILFSEDSLAFRAAYTPGELYRTNDSLEVTLTGDSASGYLLLATFAGTAETSDTGGLVMTAGLVSLVSVLIALALGWFITGRAKREVDNLIEASHRVAAGDFTTPVMAYEEGEFSQLADSFSDMMVRLKRLQKDLASTEKIAAWQSMGRKLAHEVKNPLTPISISVDDLRRSWEEKLPHFDRTLLETTTTIKSEVRRLTKLLDDFVAFAKMAPPDIRPSDLSTVISGIKSLYRADIESERLALPDHSTTLTIDLDPDRIQQVLVNLIKNGLEAAPDSVVTVSMHQNPDDMILTVSDTGPGFPESTLEDPFQPHMSTKAEGSGLGLVICQRIIQDHGGAITLSNQPQGARVDISLPIHHG